MQYFPWLSSCFSREPTKNTSGTSKTEIELDKRLSFLKRERNAKEEGRSTVGSMSPEMKLSHRYKTLYNNDAITEYQNKGKLMAQKLFSSEDTADEAETNVCEGSDTEVYTISQWLKILKNNDLENTSVNEMIHSLRHGIPNELRPQIWEFLTDLKSLRSKYPKDYYQTLKTEPSPADSQIKKDTPRTFTTDPFFTNKENNAEDLLFNILRAYANHDKEVGYTQGMNYIVGKLLIILDPHNYKDSNSKYFDSYKEDFEEKTFWFFIHIAFTKNCRQIYKSEFPKMNGMINVLDARIKSKAEDVYNLIHECDLDIVQCFHSMFICLLLDCAPLPLAQRFLDLFFIEGEATLFKVIIRAVILSKKDIKEIGQTPYVQRFLKHDMMQKCYEKI